MHVHVKWAKFYQRQLHSQASYDGPQSGDSEARHPLRVLLCLLAVPCINWLSVVERSDKCPLFSTGYKPKILHPLTQLP